MESMILFLCVGFFKAWMGDNSRRKMHSFLILLRRNELVNQNFAVINGGWILFTGDSVGFLRGASVEVECKRKIVYTKEILSLGALPPNLRDFLSDGSDTSTWANEGDCFKAQSPKPKPSSPLPQRRRDGIRNRNETTVDSRFLCLTTQESTALASCSVRIPINRLASGSGENLAPTTTQDTIVDASFDPAIAWRVASQQSRPPFHRTSHTLRQFGFLIKQILISGGGSFSFFSFKGYPRELT